MVRRTKKKFRPMEEEDDLPERRRRLAPYEDPYEEESVPRKRPTHTLKMRGGGYWNHVGVAWYNDDGSIGIVLNNSVNLSWRDVGHEGRSTLKLFPKD